MLRASSRCCAPRYHLAPRVPKHAAAASLDCGLNAPPQTHHQPHVETTPKPAATLGSLLTEPWAERQIVLTCAAVGTALGICGDGGIGVTTLIGTITGTAVGALGGAFSPFVPKYAPPHPPQGPSATEIKEQPDQLTEK